MSKAKPYLFILLIAFTTRVLFLIPDNTILETLGYLAAIGALVAVIGFWREVVRMVTRLIASD